MNIPAPFERFEGEVLPEWIDYNGHMNLAYYTVLFDQATDILFDVLGLGLRVFGGKRRGDGLAGGQPRLTLEDDEAPGHKLAVIGDARSNGKQRLDLGGGRAGASEFDRFD